MSNTESTGSRASDEAVICRRDDVLAVCVEPQRRQLLFALAAGGEQTASGLSNFGKQRVRRKPAGLDSIFKHLTMMLRSGVVIQKPNPRDGRAPLYALPPGVKVSVTASGMEFDFGACMLRLRADRD